ncbi:MAG: TrmH family RNA methyltransferase [Devosiaceae bacterium]
MNDDDAPRRANKDGPAKQSAQPRSGFARLKASKAAKKGGETKAQRAKRFAPKGPTPEKEVPYHIHGLHAVRATLGNPKRKVYKLMATPNALQRLEVTPHPSVDVETVHPKVLDELLGADTVHQGVAALIKPLAEQPLEAPYPHFSIVLDQVTDPHNVGAILRSAAAFDADAIISTTRHAARETGTLAKAASGAFELVPILTVRNLADSLEALKSADTLVIGLEGTADNTLPAAIAAMRKSADQPIALVMGSEGKGLRQKTAETCSTVARLPLTGDALASLNVSNAAVLAMYIARST